MRCLPAFLLIASAMIGLAAFSAAFQDAGASAEFHVEPRHIRATADSATIVWATPAPEAGVVEYGASEKLGYSVREEATARQHAVKLDGLKPGTTYHFRVRSSSSSPASSIQTFATAKSGVGFHVEPYLQLPGPSGMTIMWETTEPLPGLVEYGATPELGQAALQMAPPAKLHQVRLEGLSPGARCFYRVRSGHLATSIRSFRTAPPPGTGKWRMAVYGDSRSNPAVHRKVVEQIAKANVDLIVHTGDIVLSGKVYDLWRMEFFAPLAPIAGSVPWVSTIGNHEQDSENYFSYMALPGNERYFSLDFGNAHIVCLDSNGWIEKGRDSKQFRWLEDDLKAPRSATWTFAAFHHPLFSAHRDRPINQLRWDWAPLFLDPQCRVDGVLTGHDHFYARNKLMAKITGEPQSGVLFLTTAGGGASLYPVKQRDYVALTKAVHHFTLFDFDGDQVTLTPIDITGKVFDSYTLKKGPTPALELCAYEVEELREFLRKALNVAKPIEVEGPRTLDVDSLLEVPTRFQIRVHGILRWADTPGWELPDKEVAFALQPRDPLRIPLKARVAPGAWDRSPKLTIEFATGKFANRTIEVNPFKITGAGQVAAAQISMPKIDGKPEEPEWKAAGAFPLIGSGQGLVKLGADQKRLYVLAQLSDPAGQVRVAASSAGKADSKLVLSGEHARIELSDGGPVHAWSLSPDQLTYHSVDGKDVNGTGEAKAGPGKGHWLAELAIPLDAFPDKSRLRINVIHHSKQPSQGLLSRATYLDFELRPGFSLGTHPDLIPDWKVSTTSERFARIRFPGQN